MGRRLDIVGWNLGFGHFDVAAGSGAVSPSIPVGSPVFASGQACDAASILAVPQNPPTPSQSIVQTTGRPGDRIRAVEFGQESYFLPGTAVADFGTTIETVRVVRPRAVAVSILGLREELDTDSWLTTVWGPGHPGIVLASRIPLVAGRGLPLDIEIPSYVLGLAMCVSYVSTDARGTATQGWFGEENVPAWTCHAGLVIDRG